MASVIATTRAATVNLIDIPAVAAQVIVEGIRIIGQGASMGALKVELIHHNVETDVKAQKTVSTASVIWEAAATYTDKAKDMHKRFGVPGTTFDHSAFYDAAVIKMTEAVEA